MSPPLLLALLSTATAAAPATFQCCDEPRVHRVVRAWVRLHRSLSSDAAVGATSHLWALRGALRGATDLPGPEGAIARALFDDADRHSQSDPTAIRAVSLRLAPAITVLALRHEGGALSVAEAGCDDGTVWLQDPGAPPVSPGGTGCGAWR